MSDITITLEQAKLAQAYIPFERKKRVFWLALAAVATAANILVFVAFGNLLSIGGIAAGLYAFWSSGLNVERLATLHEKLSHALERFQ